MIQHLFLSDSIVFHDWFSRLVFFFLTASAYNTCEPRKNVSEECVREYESSLAGMVIEEDLDEVTLDIEEPIDGANEMAVEREQDREQYRELELERERELEQYEQVEQMGAEVQRGKVGEEEYEQGPEVLEVQEISEIAETPAIAEKEGIEEKEAIEEVLEHSEEGPSMPDPCTRMILLERFFFFFFFFFFFLSFLFTVVSFFPLCSCSSVLTP
jgi:hypothetical protein